MAGRMLQVLFSAAPLRRERTRARIAQARVTLTGTVGTEVEHAEVERLIAGVEGVLAIANRVTFERDGQSTEGARGVAETDGSDAESGDVAGRIAALFVREAGLGATQVLVTVAGVKVDLSVHAHSWHERDLAERVGAPPFSHRAASAETGLRRPAAPAGAPRRHSTWVGPRRLRRRRRGRSGP